MDSHNGYFKTNIPKSFLLCDVMFQALVYLISGLIHEPRQKRRAASPQPKTSSAEVT